MQLYIEQVYDKISRRSKMVFAITAIIMFIVHGFMLTNNMICSDSLCYFYDKYDIRYSGRWFLTYAAGISSWFDLHWLNGVLSIAYISATAVIVVYLLDIQNVFLGCLVGSILGIYPAVTKTFAYMFSADAYFMAMLFAAIAACLFIQDKWQKRLAGSVMCALSMGIYQAYLTFLLSLLILWIIKQTLQNKGVTIKQIFNIAYSGVLGGGYLLSGVKSPAAWEFANCVSGNG